MTGNIGDSAATDTNGTIYKGVNILASISPMQTTKDGRKFWRIRISRGKGKSCYSRQFFWPNKSNGEPTSEKEALRLLDKAVESFAAEVASGTFQNREEKKAAEEERRRIEEEQRKAEEAELTVRQYAETIWLPEKKMELARTTLASYELALDKHILPKIGDRKLKDVSTAELKKLLLDFQQEHSVSAARTLHVVLRSIFNDAFQTELIPISPMLRIPRPKVPKEVQITSEADKALDEEQLLYVLRCLENESLFWRTFLTLAADTGARRGELAGLQWADIDEKAGTIRIARSLLYTPADGVYISTPKNKKERIVDVGPETLVLLQELKKEQSAREKQRAEKRGDKVYHLSPWVFGQEGTQDPMHPDSATWFCKKFADKYGIEDFHLHKLRHSAASIAIRNGADIAGVSHRLGHSKVDVTARIYTHATDKQAMTAGQIQRDAIAKKKREQEKKSEGQS